MADMNDIVKLAVDGFKGNVEKYSKEQSQEVLRQALIEANGGSTVLNYRNIRDGKCNGLFTLIEEILSRTVVDGFTGDEFFNMMCEFRNVPLGDENIFIVEDDNLFVVAEAADGTQGIRRQRLGGTREVPIPTTLKVVRIYEELNRVLSGRVDFNDMINRVARSFRQQLLNDIFSLWTSASSADFGEVYFPENTAGDFSEDALLDIIAHVEAAANGKPATIIGTKKALRALKGSIMGDMAKDELYTLGYFGRFYGTPCVAVPQRHAIGTTDFLLDDNTVTVIATDEKPFKIVREGDPLVIMGDPLSNADLTQEYFYADRWGAGIVLAGGNSGIGRYELS